VRFLPTKINIPIPPAILDKMVPTKLFARLNIANKMLLGYMTLVMLTIIVVVYALVSLERINSLNRSIVKVDIMVSETSDQMLDALLAQDTYEKRYLILKSKDMKNLFEKRGVEFQTWLSALKKNPGVDSPSLDTIENLHKQYTNLFSREIVLIRNKKSDQAYAISNHELKGVLEKLLDNLRTLSASARAAQDTKMKRIRDIGGTAFLTTAFLCIFSIIAGALAGLVVTHHIASSLHKLKEATEHIAEGNFDYDPKIVTEDEIGVLSGAFLAMGRRLRKLE
jgi:nitrogen fixation/metabolism regulation signal transduction histidine kinase